MVGGGGAGWNSLIFYYVNMFAFLLVFFVLYEFPVEVMMLIFVGLCVSYFIFHVTILVKSSLRIFFQIKLGREAIHYIRD